jgi:hypothetical protein
VTAAANQYKITKILDFIFDPRYMLHRPAVSIGGPGRYHAAGYGIFVPDLSRISTDDMQQMKLVGMLEMLVPFARTHNRELIISCLNHLNSYQTDRDTWAFPKSYLQELSTGNWDYGAFMGLEENRRKEQVYEAESTFRMLRLMNMTELNEQFMPSVAVDIP